MSGDVLELVAAIGVVVNGLVAQVLAYLAARHALSTAAPAPSAKV